MEFYHSFLNGWHMIMWLLVPVSIAFALAAVVIHWIKSATLREPKAKYDYLSRYEQRVLLFLVIGVSVAAAAFLNTLRPETVALAPMWFAVRLFVTVCIGTLIGYVTYLILKYTYPSRLNKKLRKLRYKPRINPNSGHFMRLLSEDEEDVYLDEGMQAEENIFSVDYDVWIDEVTGDIKIEKYPGHLQAYECDRCGFQTLKLRREEITKKATETGEGELIKHYKCSYCGRIKRRTKTIAPLSTTPDTFKLPDKLTFKDETDKSGGAVEMRIISGTGSIKSYDFPNVEQARKFLEEYTEEEVHEL